MMRSLLWWRYVCCASNGIRRNRALEQWNLKPGDSHCHHADEGSEGRDMKSLNIPKRSEARTSTNQQASQSAGQPTNTFNEIVRRLQYWPGGNRPTYSAWHVTRRKSAAERRIRLHLQEHPSFHQANTYKCSFLYATAWASGVRGTGVGVRLTASSSNCIALM